MDITRERLVVTAGVADLARGASTRCNSSRKRSSNVCRILRPLVFFSPLRKQFFLSLSLALPCRCHFKFDSTWKM